MTDTPRGTCFECRERFELPGYDGDYCSEECHYTNRGEKAINLLRHDHRLCANCGNWIKEVSRPTDDWKHHRESAVEKVLASGGEYHNVEDIGIALDATETTASKPTTTDVVIGHQYATPNAVPVEKEYQLDEYRSHYGTGLGCTCGVTDTRDTDETLQDIELANVLANYVTVFRSLEREGQLEARISKQIFFETFRETRDIPYSLGKALYGSKH